MVTDYENKVSVEEWADEILKRRDSYDDQYVYQTLDFTKALESVVKSFSKSLVEEKNRYQNQSIPNPQILANLITAVSKYLIDGATYRDNKDELIQSLHFYKLTKSVFLETNRKTYEAFSQGEEIGLFILALKLCGSSVNQAKKSVSAWTGMSVTKVESFYTKISNKTPHSTDNFIWLNNIELANVLLNFEEKFPNTKVKTSLVKKTYDAYLEVKRKLIELFDSPDYVAMMPIRALQIGIDWDEVETIRDRIIALK